MSGKTETPVTRRRELNLFRSEEYNVDDPLGYELKPYSKMAQLIDEFVTIGKNRLNTIWAFTNVDVTEAMKKIEEYKKKTGITISFTGFIISVFARVVSYHKYPMNTMIKNKKMLYVFNDVDVSTNMERTLPDGTKKPVSFTIRKAHTKTLKQISDEIRTAQQKKEIQATTAKRSKFLARIAKNLHKFPKFIRKMIIIKLLSDPVFKKKNFGTVNVSSIGSFASHHGHAIHLSPHNLSLAVGGMDKLPYNVNGEIINRNLVGITLAMNHTVIDGGPATRFFNDLCQWLSNYCLDADWCFKSLGI